MSPSRGGGACAAGRGELARGAGPRAGSAALLRCPRAPRSWAAPPSTPAGSGSRVGAGGGGFPAEPGGQQGSGEDRSAGGEGARAGRPLPQSARQVFINKPGARRLTSCLYHPEIQAQG